MVDDELDERYLSWLYSQVASVKTKSRSRTHWKLFRQLRDTIFVSIVPNDENRIADARDLRYEYLSEAEDEQGDPDWTRSPCTMLEVLFILSRAAAFEMDDSMRAWFWHFLQVLELQRFNDSEYDDHAEEVVANTLERVIWRTYEPDGSGGLFPLRRPSEDQRDVELWYQLNAYLLEQF